MATSLSVEIDNVGAITALLEWLATASAEDAFLVAELAGRILDGPKPRI